MKEEFRVRLHKYIADCGLASRRKAEEMIADHLVTVNGRIITEMGFKINPSRDAVKVKGKLVTMKAPAIYIALHKPARVLTTLNDPDGRRTVKDLLVGLKTRVFPVGRFDFNSEGLLIMTNDGDFAQSINHPTKKLTKTYLVKVDGQPTENDLKRLQLGITLAEGRVRALLVKRTKVGGQYDWIRIVLNEGKHHQVQRMFAKIGFDVIKMKRIAIGKLTIGGIDKGDFRYLNEEDLKNVFKPYDKN